MFASIVVGTDGSETASEAVGRAVELAQAHGAALHVVSAYAPDSGPATHGQRAAEPAVAEQWTTAAQAEVAATLEAAAALAAQAGVAVETYARPGDAADSILDVAEERGADLIIVGNKGMTGAKRFLLGSVPNKVSHHAPCSVLIIRTT